MVIRLNFAGGGNLFVGLSCSYLEKFDLGMLFASEIVLIIFQEIFSLLDGIKI